MCLEDSVTADSSLGGNESYIAELHSRDIENRRLPYFNQEPS